MSPVASGCHFEATLRRNEAFGSQATSGKNLRGHVGHRFAI
jgi:hypothetical protein